MTWTAPATAVTGNTLTAAFWNAQVRDNMLESAAAAAAAAGDIVYADAANSMGSRLAIGAVSTNLVSTGSAPVWRSTSQMIGDSTYTSETTPTSFADLDDSGWSSGANMSVAVTVTTGTKAEVHYGLASGGSSTGGVRLAVSYRVSGATTLAASATWEARVEISAAGDVHSIGRSHVAALTAGSNTFTLQALGSSSGATFTLNRPFLIVRAL